MLLSPSSPHPSFPSTLPLGALLVGVGPLQDGWAAHAGAAPLAQSNAVSTASLPPTTFSDAITGSAQAQNDGSVQPGTNLLHLRLQSDGSYPVTASYGLLVVPDFGGARFIRGVFSLASKSLAWSCSGAATLQPPSELDSTRTPPGGHPLQIATTFNIDNSGAVSGEIQASSAAPSQSSDDSNGA